MKILLLSTLNFVGFPDNRLTNKNGHVFGSKRNDQYAVWFGIFLLAIIILFPLGGFNYIATNASKLSSVTTYTTPVPLSFPTGAYCPATGNVAPAGPGTTAPLGCQSQTQKLQINLNDLYAGAALAASAYTCKLFQFTTNPPAPGATPTTDPLTGVSGYWVATESIAAGAAPTSCTSGNSYPSGARIQVEVCKDTTPACVIGDFTAQKTVMYCPLPSIVGTGLCGAGLGAGVVPYLNSGAYTSVPTNFFTLPIVLEAGQALANSTPDTIRWTYQNGTSVTAASNCYVKTNGAANCAAPTATSTGRFSTILTVGPPGTGGGTLPANPMGAGFASFIPVDIQTGSTARGPLNVALQIEVKATTGTDMCVPTSNTLNGGITPIVVSKNSATDLLYIFVIPDGAFTLAKDASGNTISGGTITGTIAWDCSQVYSGGSTDVVTLTGNIYTYYSTKYVSTIVGSLNPEAVTQNPTAFAVSINQ